MSIQDAYENEHVDFEIRPEYEDDAEETYDIISFRYAAPAISVDTSGRYATHEIIGGTTVRQKIGEDPVEVEVTGVCLESTARKIDTLRDADYGTILAGRLPGDRMDVQFASTSTSPLEDSGAVDIEQANAGDAEFLHTFTLSCTEVNIQ